MWPCARLVTPPSAKSNGNSSTNGEVDPGISVRFGAVQDEDVKMEDAAEDTHGVSKRKSRASIDQKKSYAEPDSSDEDDQPLVRPDTLPFATNVAIGFSD
jgi:DNA topoisomerase-1